MDDEGRLNGGASTRRRMIRSLSARRLQSNSNGAPVGKKEGKEKKDKRKENGLSNGRKKRKKRKREKGQKRERSNLIGFFE